MLAHNERYLEALTHANQTPYSLIARIFEFKGSGVQVSKSRKITHKLG